MSQAVPSATPDGDRILRQIAAGTAGATSGDAFFRALVQHLAEALGFRAAFVSEFSHPPTRVCTLAFWDRDHFLDNFEYRLEHTPCERVLHGEVAYYPEQVQQLFPLHSEALKAFNAQSYLAIPMVDAKGSVLGHLAALHDSPLQNRIRELSVFQIFGVRAAAEIERRRAEIALCQSESRLASVLDNAMDAILAVDANHCITLFNRAAETMFRCDAAWAMGQPITRFLSPQTRGALRALLDAEQGPARQLWAPDGLVAVRADDDPFPIELTVSPLDLPNGAGFTFILRDVNERQRAAQDLSRLQAAHANLQEELQRRDEVDGMVIAAPAMQKLFDQLKQVERTDTTVLITGETGTGKERIATAMHRASPRANRALVTVNCAALPGELIESELFGHERGAFTGATHQRRGRFELADQGTIFLDEVGELSLQAQAKLLRVLQEQRFERVGGSQSLQVDARLIAATNRQLEQMVAEGSFRADLYYRLNVFPLQVPALRDRREDILPLAKHFLERFGRKLGREFIGFSPQSELRLQRYRWPGNIRELQNVVERNAILAAGPLVDICDPLMETATSNPHEPSSTAADDVMRAHIERVLSECAWTIEGQSGAAVLLGLKPSTLRHRMKQLGIVKPSRHRRSSAASN